MAVIIKTAEQIKAMRRAGQILAETFEYLKSNLKPGQTTADLSVLAKQQLTKLGGEPTFLGYNGFPDVICVAVNDEVVHGIPGPRVIAAGDVVSLDLGVTYRGLIADGCITVVAGNKPPALAVERLLSATSAALTAGIEQARAGNRVGDVSAAIERHLKAARLGVVEVLSGHGVGTNLHEDPEVPNLGRPGSGPVLKSGMTLAIEPITTLGSPEVRLSADGWTYVSSDGSLAAEFEHTILVTDGAPEILTRL